MVYIVMGVSGCGKTTIGQRLAARLGLPFYDGDDFHPPANKQKMMQKQPLNDSDRQPWLESLAAHIIQWNAADPGGAVLACSALKQHYRDTLSDSADDQGTTYIYLRGDKNTITQRLTQRSGHFFPAQLLESQFESLQEPANAITIDIDLPEQEALEAILQQLEARHG